MELNDKGPIDRVRKMCNAASIERVLILEQAMLGSYDEEKVDELREFLKTRTWGNGEQVTTMLVMLCANWATMPLNRHPNMIDNVLVAFLAVARSLVEHLRESNPDQIATIEEMMPKGSA